MASDIYVAFGADTGDLEAALALAQSNVKAMARELRTLAEEMRTTGASADSELGAKMKALGAEMAEAKEKATGLKKELSHEDGGVLENMVGGLNGMLGPLSAVKASLSEMVELFAAAFAVEKVIEFVRQMGELGEKTERTQKILGLTSEQVGELNFAAEMTGTNTESLTQTMSRFELSLAKAAAGTSPAAAGLKALGVDAKELIGLPLPEQLDKMANAVSHFADGTNKTAALTAINRGFIELLPLLDEGARGFEELKEKLEATNSKLDETTTGRLVEMQHGFVELGAAIRGDALQSFIPFIDSVNGLNRILIDLAEDFSAAVKNGGLLAGTLKAAAVQVQVLEQVLSAAIFGLTQFEIVGEAGVKVVIAGFIGLGEAIGDVFKVLAASVPAFFTGLVTAGAEAVKSVGNQFMGLGAIIGNTMILNFSGAKQAFTALGTDMVASGKRINDSFKGVFDFSAANEDLKRATDRMGDAGREGAIRLVKSVDTAAKEYAEIWGIKTKEVVEAHKAATPAINLEAQKQAKEAEKAARDALAATMEAAQGQVRATEDATKQQISAIDSLARRHQITEAQKVSMTVAALNDELKAEQSIVQKELELSNLTLAQKAKLNEQLRQMAAQNAAAIQKIQQEGIEKTVSDWRSYGDTVAGMINSQVNGVLRGTTSIAQAFKNMAASGIEDVIKFCIKWAAEHAAVIAANILGLTAQTGATVAATSAQTATIGVGVAAQKAINATTIQGDAARAAAGAYAAMAGVPLIGPVLAPAAAAVAFAGVEAFGSFDKGAWSVPADMVALIHQGEKVIPAGPPSAALDALAAGRGGQGGDVQASGGDMHLHVHATDAQSVAQLFRNNGRALAQTVRDVMNANQSLRTSF